MAARAGAVGRAADDPGRPQRSSPQADDTGQPRRSSPQAEPGSPQGEPAEDPPRPPRIYRGELTSAVSALALLALMFFTEWYGVAGVPDPSAARPAISSAENAWNGLSIVRWVMLATILVALGSVVLHATQRSHGTRTDTSLVVVTLGSLTTLLLLYRVLIELPQTSKVIDQKLGAVLGLACALAITLGGLESIREQRTLARAVATRPRRRRRLASRRPER